MSSATPVTAQAALDEWVRTVDRHTRRRQAIASTLKDGRAGALTIPARFALKVAELGPRRAVRLAFTVVRARMGQS